jgi:hypothetical protein
LPLVAQAKPHPNQKIIISTVTSVNCGLAETLRGAKARVQASAGFLVLRFFLWCCVPKTSFFCGVYLKLDFLCGGMGAEKGRYRGR